MGAARTLPAFLLAGALLLAPACSGRQADQPCWYTAVATDDDPDPAFAEHPACATLDERGQPEIAARHLEAAHYDDGMAQMLIAGGWYYVKADGSALQVIPFDNGPDYWSEGLVRSRRHGKIVYSNRDFAEVIPPRYDWGWPFEEGLALVCSGCREVEEEGSEHRSVAGGQWGYLDAAGAEVIAVRHSRDEAWELRDALPARQ